MKLALCQLAVSDCKSSNLKHAEDMLSRSAKDGADMAILPEMFCISYKPKLFKAAAEPSKGGDAYEMLRCCAKKFKLTIVGGSVPQLCGDKLYNASLCFGSDGTFLGQYRKAHLFDVNINGFSFAESETISAGENKPLIIDAPIKTGVSICFDIRFPEWAAYAAQCGAELFALPAAFSNKTGPAHWELLLRARALDNQMFVAGVAPAAASFSYAHSMLCSPNGEVLADMGEDEGIRIIEISQASITVAKQSIPLKNAREKLHSVLY